MQTVLHSQPNQLVCVLQNTGAMANTSTYVSNVVPAALLLCQHSYCPDSTTAACKRNVEHKGLNRRTQKQPDLTKSRGLKTSRCKEFQLQLDPATCGTMPA
jgi:hypothetical protein